MNTNEIYKILDRKRRLEYDTKAEFAEKIGVSRQRYSEIMKVLQKNSERNSFNVICKTLEMLELKIVVTDKNGKEINLDWWFQLFFEVHQKVHLLFDYPYLVPPKVVKYMLIVEKKKIKYHRT